MMNKTVGVCIIGVVVAMCALCATMGVWAGLMSLCMAMCCAGLAIEFMMCILKRALVRVQVKIKDDIESEVCPMKKL